MRKITKDDDINETKASISAGKKGIMVRLRSLINS